MEGCRDCVGLGGAVVERLSSEYQKLKPERGHRFYISQAVLGYLPGSLTPPLLPRVGTGAGQNARQIHFRKIGYMMFIANCNLASLFRSSPCLITYNMVEGKEAEKGLCVTPSSVSSFQSVKIRGETWSPAEGGTRTWHLRHLLMPSLQGQKAACIPGCSSAQTGT